MFIIYFLFAPVFFFPYILARSVVRLYTVPRKGIDFSSLSPSLFIQQQLLAPPPPASCCVYSPGIAALHHLVSLAARIREQYIHTQRTHT